MKTKGRKNWAAESFGCSSHFVVTFTEINVSQGAGMWSLAIVVSRPEGSSQETGNGKGEVEIVGIEVAEAGRSGQDREPIKY